MTRCGFSVFAVFCGVLALAPPASAECAWVLWHEASDAKTYELEGPKPQASYKTIEECIKRIDEEWRLAKTTEQALARKDLLGRVKQSRDAPTAATIMSLHQDKAYMVTYTCLPDTVDPRGPKSSGR